MVISTIIILAFIGLIYVGFEILNNQNKILKTMDEKPKKISYRNLYISHGSNDYVYGLNKYATQAEAKANQQCPPGYRWHSAISSRRWV